MSGCSGEDIFATIRRMGQVPDPNESSTAAPTRRLGWFRRLPLWARIAIPGVLLLGGVAVVLVLASRPPEPVDPVDPVEATRSACQSGIREEIESHDVEVVEVSFFSVDSTPGDEVYLARGDAAYRAADAVQRVLVRCTVRFEDGAMGSPSIRFSEPITAG
jgi:hypothetical protein